MYFNELNLHPSLLRGITERGYTEMTAVQEQTLVQTLLGKIPGYADVYRANLACPFRAGEQEEADFRRINGGCNVCSHRLPANTPGIGLNPRGQIDGKDRFAGLIDGLYGPAGKPRDLAPDA